MGPRIITRVGAGSVGRTERNRRGAAAKHGGASRSCADLRRLVRKVDIERALAPYLFKERPVDSLRKTECDAGSVRETHFLSVDGRALCLLGIGDPQQISSRA